MWNSLIAALRRELLREGELRDLFGSTRSRARRRCQANTPILASSAGCASIGGQVEEMFP